MGTINALYETLPDRFGDKVRLSSYNVFYDDTYEIRPLMERIRFEMIPLPAVFIDDELLLQGQIDGPTILQSLARRGVEEL